jgi:pimeloyl-ACP methyl ester carboxylesterase
VVVFIHGGFWRARYTADTIRPLAVACAEAGLHAWNVEYPRVGMQGGGWPGTGLAVRDAVDQALSVAGSRPLVLIGHSAGGQLALWAAAERPAVTAVVSLAGVCDLRSAAAQGLGEGAVLELFGQAEPSAAQYRETSPIERLPLGAPALLIHGDADDRVPISQSRSYQTTAEAQGDFCELHELPGGDHFEVVDPGGRASRLGDRPRDRRLLEVALSVAHHQMIGLPGRGGGMGTLPLGLVRALGGLVVDQSLGGIHVSERGMPGHQIARRGDPETLGEHGAQRLDLHLAEPGKRGQAGAQVLAVAGVGPDAGGVTVVLVTNVDGQIVNAYGHRARKTMDRGTGSEHGLEVGLRERGGVDRTHSLEQRLGAGKRLLHRHLLVECEADQQGHRIGGDQGVGLI